MVCYRCGMQQKEDALFCENCGAALKNPVSVAPVMPPDCSNDVPYGASSGYMAKSMETWKILLIVEIIAAVFAVVVLFQNVTSFFGAQKVGERFFAAVTNGDWEEAYRMLEVDESEFINAAAFRKANESNGSSTVNTYSVSEKRNLEQGLNGTTITITYRKKGDSNDSTYNVYLNRQAKKQYLFFDNWKVASNQYMVQDFTISVPKGASAAIDGVPLSKSYLSGSEEDGDSYTIPYLFAGRHEAEISMESMETVKESFDTAYDSSYRLYSMQVSEEAVQQALNMAGSNLQKIYAAALHCSTFPAIAELFTTNQEAGIEESYQTFMESMQEEGYSKIESLDMSKISGTAESYMEDGRAVIEVYMPFHYALTYSYEDWDGKRQTDTYKDEDSVTFYFIYENGSWVLNNLGCHSLYY